MRPLGSANSREFPSISASGPGVFLIATITTATKGTAMSVRRTITGVIGASVLVPLAVLSFARPAQAAECTVVRVAPLFGGSITVHAPCSAVRTRVVTRVVNRCAVVSRQHVSWSTSAGRMTSESISRVNCTRR
ncbi:hypothetical protein GCM10020369_63110 [Cryptosporangium minutisporangium]|uniref:Uncharacterized protein n=1 Tax=Cryptosporangium minutisporangium TaxID=113569 RepID=A0ABP6T7I8_9ACTN